MATQDTTLPYEFLVRWNHETGDLQGAHVIRWRKVVINGDVVRDAPMDPEPLTPNSVEIFGDFLASVNTGMAAQNAELSKQVEAINSLLETEKLRVQVLEKELADKANGVNQG